METKTCTKCLKAKPLSEFHCNRTCPDGYHGQCKECKNAAGRVHRATNAEKYNARARGYYAKHYARARSFLSLEERVERDADGSLRRNYGISLVDYNAMLELQGGGCAICGKTPEENARRLCVDHNHTTGIVRGLLCDNCNKALGNLKDSPELCCLAALYLIESQAARTYAQEEVIEGEAVEVKSSQ